MEQVTISLEGFLKEKVEAILRSSGMTWAEFIENAANDPFYTEKNLRRIQESIQQLEEGAIVRKTMAELEEMAGG